MILCFAAAACAERITFLLCAFFTACILSDALVFFLGPFALLEFYTINFCRNFRAKFLFGKSIVGERYIFCEYQGYRHQDSRN